MEKYIGLSSVEVEQSEKINGTNEIPEKERITLMKKFWMSFEDPIITILLVSLGINIFFTFLGKVDWYECVGIFASVLISTFVSTLSEYKNESTFNKLQNEASKIISKVYRDNRLTEIPVDKIVKDDVVLLQSGDIIPADGIVVSGKIKVDQSSLNGESLEIEKMDDGTTDRDNFDFWSKKSLFRGSVVCEGQALMQVTETGENTVYGKLSVETQIAEEKSPLNIKLSKLAMDISKFGYIGAIVIFLMFIIHNIIVQNQFSLVLIQQYFMDLPQVISDFVEALIMCVTILVVAVPDGLPLMIAIVCSLNMRKMLKDNVLVRKIVGIETSGGLNILFTDKTGTLTKGQLSVTNFLDGAENTYKSASDLPEKIKKMMQISIKYNSGASLEGDKIIGGNSTEKALLKHIKNLAISNENYIKTDETPFSSKNKFSECYIKGKECFRLIKGAPEIILSKCSKYLDNNGQVRDFNCKSVEKKINEYAEKAERVIVFAYSELSAPNKLIFLSAVSIKDEIRRGVKKAVDEVIRAGINVVMITGDKKETAVSVARECNIINSENDIVLTSDDMKKMSDDEIKNILPRLCVVARAVPADKSRLVRIAKDCSMVTGMTGDGVNDAPALKSADVGFAMGSGTDIAKESGDVVILDDRFESIKNAVLYGRTIYKSIKKFVTFQLTINIAAVSVSVLSFFFGVIKPLSITQMLWINLLMDTLAAIAFGGEAALKKYLLEKPIRKNDTILDKKMWNSILVNGGFITILSSVIFTSEHIRSLFTEETFYTGYFVFFVFASIFNAFNTRADGIDLIENLAANKRFILVMGLISVIQILITYFGGEVLRTSGLNLKEWLVALFFAILIIPTDLIRKLISK